MTELCERFAILELYEEWEAPVRSLILQQFENESEKWQTEPPSRRSNNDDLFPNVKLPASLDVGSSISFDEEGNPLVGNERFLKEGKRDSKRKSKKATLLKKLLRRKSKERDQYQDQTTRVKSITSSTSHSSRHRRKRRKKASANDRNNVKVPEIRRTDQINSVSGGQTPQTSVNQQQTLDGIHNNVSKLPLSLNCNRGSEIPFILREGKEPKGGNSSNTLSVLVPIVPQGLSAPQLAMQIVQSLSWDTVRRIRRRGYAEGFDIVLVKPKGMPEAPSLLAMQNSKGDLTISCDSLSNQKALSQILGLLYRTESR